jgi:hypothetical protein
MIKYGDYIYIKHITTGKIKKIARHEKTQYLKTGKWKIIKDK